jgi:hypothetical protein
MSWTPSDKEVAALVAADARVRYEYFVKHVADVESVWSLRGESGWVLAAGESGRELVPVWPHARYAATCISGEWAGSAPESIQLSVWLDRWTPGNDQGRQARCSVPDSGSPGGFCAPRAPE